MVLGPYVLNPVVISRLQAQVEHDVRSNGEIQLTSALDEASRSTGLSACVLSGQALDIGVPVEYGRTMTAMYARFQAKTHTPRMG